MKNLRGLGPAVIAAVAAATLGAFAGPAGAATAPGRDYGGHADHAVFVQTDNLAGNQVVAYHRGHDGSLTQAGTYSTGGLGGMLAGSVVDHLASQGSLTYDRRHGVLFAVNAGSNTVSVFGGVLDSSCDRIADAAIFGGLLWYFAQHGQKWLLLAALLCLILGGLTSYIRARAEAAGLNATVGIAERAERLIIVLVGTGLTGPPFRVPYLQSISLWLLVAASTITVGQRLATVYRQSRDHDAASTGS